MKYNQPIEKLEGMYTALITPMRKGDGLANPIDFDKLCMLVEDQIAAGVDGLLVAGTTGQSPTLNVMEQVHLAKIVSQAAAGRTQLMVGAGSNCTREAIELSRQVEKTIGPTTFLHVTGYYNNPPPAGQYEHYMRVADAVEGNVILYNIPGRTASRIDLETTLKLAEHPKIIGIKDATGDIKYTQEVISKTGPSNFRVLSGNCNQTADMIQAGGYGVISATANIAPKLFMELTHTALEGDFKRASELKERANKLVDAVFTVKSPIPLSYIFRTEVRLPLVILDKAKPEAMKMIDDVLAEFSTEELGIDLSKYK